jgi:hypothetical protein
VGGSAESAKFEQLNEAQDFGSIIIVFGFFLNLLEWQRKPRVWPGQAAPPRSIFTIYCTLALSEFKLIFPKLPLAWQSQGRESMVPDVHPSPDIS